MNEYNIYLIRHGKTTANESGLYCGHTDLPLSQKGEYGILELKNRGIYPEADIFIISGLIRTKQTLALIYGDVPFQCVPEIKEYNFGGFEMKGYEELKKREDYQRWIMDETGVVYCPSGESKKEFTERVLRGFEQIIQAARVVNAPAAVICHGGVIATIMENLFAGRKNFYEWQPAAGQGYWITENKIRGEIK